MAISVDQIDYWRALPTETEVLEFKEAKLQFSTDKLYEYAVAIGNEGGGHLILGIRNEIPRIIVGTRAIDNPIGMSEKVFNKLGFRVDIEAVNHPDGRVVVVQIPGCPKDAPFNLDGTYLMRVGESVQPMSPDRLRRFFSEAPTDWLEEPTKTKLGPAKVLSLLNTNILFESRGIPVPTMASDIMDRLCEANLLDDEGGNAFTIRRIAALLLANDLKSFPDLARKTARVTVYRGMGKTSDPIDNTTGSMGYAVGFSRLLKYVDDRIPHREVIQDGIRKTVNMIPEIVVRELLANALVHQDLTITGTSVTVEIYPNRLQVANPGAPIVPVDRLINSARSRNERLAGLMTSLGICEERGSGIDKVVDAIELLHLPAPDFRVIDNRMVCTVFGPRDFAEMDRADKIRACAQHCALKWETSGRMTNKSLRERFKLPKNKTHLVSTVLEATEEAGFIKLDEKVGTSKKFARYVPAWT